MLRLTWKGALAGSIGHFRAICDLCGGPAQIAEEYEEYPGAHRHVRGCLCIGCAADMGVLDDVPNIPACLHTAQPQEVGTHAVPCFTCGHRSGWTYPNDFAQTCRCCGVTRHSTAAITEILAARGVRDTSHRHSQPDSGAEIGGDFFALAVRLLAQSK